MSTEKRVRFATRALLLHLAAVALVVTLCTGVYLALAVQQLRAEAESTALGIARTLAEDAQVRETVTAISASDDEPDAPRCATGSCSRSPPPSWRAHTGALFVVITDDHGIRLAHPLPSRIGEVVSTPFAEVLAGHEVVDWQTGTLGESARAKVPVRDDTGTPVGEISVGFERTGVFDDLPRARRDRADGRRRARARARDLPSPPPPLGAVDPRRAARAGRPRAEPDGGAERCRRRRARGRSGRCRAGEQCRGGSAPRLHDPVGRRVGELPLPPVVRDTATEPASVRRRSSATGCSISSRARCGATGRNSVTC